MLSNKKLDFQVPLSLTELPYKRDKPILVYDLEGVLFAKNATLLWSSGEEVCLGYDNEANITLRIDEFSIYDNLMICDKCGIAYLSDEEHVCASSYSEFKDLDIVINALGGAQSALRYDFTEFEPEFLFRVAAVLKQGKDKYGEKNWQKIEFKSHMNHAFYHLFKAMTDDNTEDHLANATCRVMFAMHMKSLSQLTQSQEHHQ